MKAQLKGIDSIDLPSGPPELPADPSDCWIVVQADIGTIGSTAADTFTFYVCTPTRLQRALEIRPFQEGRHLLIVKQFDWDTVEAAIRSLIDDLEGENWDELATRLGRYGHWEFEDYVESANDRNEETPGGSTPAVPTAS